MQQEQAEQKVKEPELPKTRTELYEEALALPEHKRTVKDRGLITRYEAAREEERIRGSLISRISDRAKAFGNVEKTKIQRRVTDKVKAIRPQEHAAVTSYMQSRKKAADIIKRQRNKALREIERLFNALENRASNEWDARIVKARKSFQDQYAEYEQELSEALEDCSDQVNSFLEIVPTLDNPQMEKLLLGEAVEIIVDDVKDHVVIPGV